jgi:type I restriction enzyme S subunit
LQLALPHSDSDMSQVGRWGQYTVAQLQDAGSLLVEDGNHGEYRPLPHEFSSIGVSFIRATDLGAGCVKFGSASRINGSARARIRKGIGAGGDVILSHKGTVGKIAFAPLDCEPFVCSPQTTFWRSLDQGMIDRRYLYYYLCSDDFRQQLDARKGETDMADYVSLTAQRELRVCLPPIEEQRSIGYILGALDNKIELNQRMNQTLESIARAMFRSWFLDFDPVIAKAAGRQPFGMSADVAAQFSSHFVNSPIGSLPDGWGVSDIGREFSVVMGQSPPGHTYNEQANGLPFYQGRTDFGIRYPKLRMFCTAPTRFAEAGDTLISVRAPVGGLNIALLRCCIGRGLAAVRHRAGSRAYTYYALWSLEDEFDKFNADGTVFGSISKGDFHRVSCLAPPQVVIDAYERIAAPLDGLIETNTRQTATLASLRDTLLPRLMSGELRVRDAERLVGAHV